MLTGDENIVKAQVVVQYKVRDSAKYLFNVKDLELAVSAATEVALRSVVGSNTIDFVLLEGRTIVQDEVATFLQRLLDDYDSGLLVTAVKLQKTFPPDEVKDAFDEVVRAREDKQTLIREAEGYAADRVPKARGEAEQMMLVAEAFKEQRVLEAEGDIAKFLKVIREHEVPAAFQALANSGVSQASEVLSQLGAIKSDIVLVITGTESATDTGLDVADESTPSLSRETLTEILKLLGVVDSSRTPEEVTSQVLVEALAQLGLADEYEQLYLEAIRLTRERLYLETMEDVLSDTEKFIIDPDSSGNLVPFLPLKELTGSAQTQEASQ
jgi:regulator of protease activity HflC (stomatin/prohibitin superfamily)